MQIVRDWRGLSEALKGAAVAVGAFDGVHRGTRPSSPARVTPPNGWARPWALSASIPFRAAGSSPRLPPSA